MVSARRALCIALLLSAACALGAEEQPGVERRVLLQVTQGQGAAMSADELFVVGRSLLMRLAEAGGRDIRVDMSSATAVTDDALAAQAVQRGDDAWLSVEISAEGGLLRARARSYDLFNKAPAFDTTMKRDARIQLVDLPLEKWDEIVGAVKAAYGPKAVSAQVRAVTGSATVTVVALPGTRVTGPVGVDVTVGKEGNAEIVLETPGQYTLRAELIGYRPVTRALFLTESRVVPLAQAPAPLFALDASIFDAGIPNVELSWFFLPDTDFLRAGLDIYGLSLAFDTEGLLFSRPVTELSLEVGHVIGRTDDLFHYTVGFGAFLRINHTEGFPWLDTSSPGGMCLVLGADIGITPSQRFFIEYTPRFYRIRDLSGFQSFYIRNTNNNNDWPGWIFESGRAEELLVFRIGYRWLL